MINQTALVNNIHQVFLGASLHHKPAPTSQKNRLFAPAFLLFAISLVLILITSFWVIVLVFANKPELQENLSGKVVELKQKTSFSLPVRLRIETINVDAVIEPVGLTLDGTMDTPKEVFKAGWFDLGPQPGEVGSAVIAGHLDSKDGSAGVFKKLHLLKAGDEVLVIDGSDISRSFIVMESQTYDWDEDVPEVFYRADGSYLNLITCSGVWSRIMGKFEQRLVVFTTFKQ